MDELGSSIGRACEVPNRVVSELFWDTVRAFRSERAELGADLSEIVDAVHALARDGDLSPLAGLVEQYLDGLLSNRDFRGFGESELKIAFLMLVHAPRIYLVKSERELDRGYVDILLLRRPGIPAPYRARAGAEVPQERGERRRGGGGGRCGPRAARGLPDRRRAPRQPAVGAVGGGVPRGEVTPSSMLQLPPYSVAGQPRISDRSSPIVGTRHPLPSRLASSLQ